MSGYTSVAIALALVGLAAFFLVAPGCHHAHAWHKRRMDSGQATMEPSHLILIGLAGVWVFATVALAGVIWQTRTSPKAANEIATTSTPAAEQLPQAAVVRTDASDIPNKIAVIDELLTILREELAPLLGTGPEIDWKKWLYDNKRSEYDAILASYMVRTRDILQKISRLRNNNERYPDIHSMLDPKYARTLESALDRFRQNIHAIGDGPYNDPHVNVVYFIRPSSDALTAAIVAMRDWSTRTQQTLVNLRKTLSG